jgi:hypothetical protein
MAKFKQGKPKTGGRAKGIKNKNNFQSIKHKNNDIDIHNVK